MEKDTLNREDGVHEAKITRTLVVGDIFTNPTILPTALLELKPGDIVYVDENHPLALGVIKKHRMVCLTKDKSAEVHILSIECLE